MRNIALALSAVFLLFTLNDSARALLFSPSQSNPGLTLQNYAG